MIKLENIYAVFKHNNRYFINHGEPLFAMMIDGKPVIMALGPDGFESPKDDHENFVKFAYFASGTLTQAKLDEMQRKDEKKEIADGTVES